MKPSKVAWSTFHKKKTSWTASDQGEASLDLPTAGEVPVDETAAALKRAVGGHLGRVSLSLRTQHFLLRVVELPSREIDELTDMVDLQVDKFSPFPVEQMQVSFEVLSQHETVSRVLIAAVQSELVETQGHICRQAGMLPHWIDVDILGWWHLIRESGKLNDSGREVLLIDEQDDVGMIVVQNGLPVLFRSLGMSTAQTDAESLEEFREELLFSLTSLEAEWGVPEHSGVVIWSEEPLPDVYMDMLRACFSSIRAESTGQLSPLSDGLALRAIQYKPGQANFEPTAWRAEETQQQLRRRLISVTAVFLAVWFACVAVFAGFLWMQKKELSRIQSRAEKLEQTAADLRNIREKVRSLEAYADRSYSALESLREAAMLLPGNVEFNSFIYKKGKSISVRGEAVSQSSIYDYIGALEKSGMFTEIKTERIATKRTRGATVTDFKLTFELPEEPQP